MNLDQLSDDGLFKIFNYLQFKEIIGFGRVSRRCHQVSNDFISRIKVLELDKIILDPRKLASVSMASLFSLCSKNLQKVTLCGYLDTEVVEIFAQFPYPKLAELDMAALDTCTANALGQILRNAPNLKMLKFDGSQCYDSDLGDLNFDRLDTLIVTCKDRRGYSLAFLTGRAPNLKNLYVEKYTEAHVFHEFVAKCPNLETAICELWEDPTKPMVAFWQLPLKRLCISHFERINRMYATVSDDIAPKIGTWFPDLERLEITNPPVSNAGLGALAALKNLQELVIDDMGYMYSIVEIQRLNASKKLRKLEINQGGITHEALVAIVNGYHSLRFLKIRFIGDTDLSSQEAVEIAKSFHRCGAPLTIGINDYCWSAIWTSDEVNQVLKEMPDDGNVKFVFGSNLCEHVRHAMRCE